MSVLYCPRCETERKIQVERIEETYPVRGEPITVQSKVAICSRCHEKIFDEELDSENINRAYEIYRKKHDLLLPGEISEIREKYGISQISLAKLLGWGEVTINRYENGAIQDKAHDEVLRLLNHPRTMNHFYERNHERLPSSVSQGLRKRIKSLLGEEEEVGFENRLRKTFAEDEPNEMSGYREFDLDKVNHMVLFFSKHLKGVYKTMMNKLLWYTDFLCFKTTSCSISGSRYLAYKLGPVPDHYALIFGDMERRNLIEISEEFIKAGDNGNDIMGDNIVAKEELNPDMFSDVELKCLEYVAKKFGKFTTSKIVQYSHEEKAYRKTPQSEFINYHLADELSISLP